MKIAVRYYSRSGNTKLLAEAIAKEVGAEAISVDSQNAGLTEPTDVLFTGGALYAYGLNKHMKDYLKTLSKETVKKAVVFSTSWISKHSIDLIKGELAAKGIPVTDTTIYAKSKPDDKAIAYAKATASLLV